MSSEDGSCQPVCQQACPAHSSCSKPGECVCDEGYTIAVDGSCQPICSPACPDNGSCLSPNVCICKPGYVLSQNHSLCEAHCPESCADYARCVAPNQCECYPGFEMSQVEQVCQPKCSQDCSNGFCFAPDKCACNSGYLMGPNQTCEPQCSSNCIHGKCIAPNSCECEPGYRFATDSKDVCEPVCEPACELGTCMAPQLCICQLGYEPTSKELPHLCRPSCTMSCVNGSCVAPEKCACNAGYVPADGLNATSCRPSCSGDCSNGDCVAPEQCLCHSGYERTAAGCQLRLEVTTSTERQLDELQQKEPGTNCSSISCSCWRAWTEIEEAAIKCVNICQDAFDKPCVDLKLCSCDQATGQLLCPAEEHEQRLVCQATTAIRIDQQTEQNLGEAAHNSRRPAVGTSKWPVILAWSAGSFIVLLLIIVASHLYLKHRRQEAIQEQESYCYVLCNDKL